MNTSFDAKSFSGISLDSISSPESSDFVSMIGKEFNEGFETLKISFANTLGMCSHV